ncbi:SafA/ExsA family spore coat assembly protein [Lentibacillus halophilus]|uniref:SafA/ExsA family spore coat assembly protein n=1 Tax=Lentibacillus halophilus TaxID=295065 RepID=UPI003CD08862
MDLKIHIVQKGDTLWEIAKEYDVDFEQVKNMNPQLSSPDMIMPGMKIKIPGSSKPVKTHDTDQKHKQKPTEKPYKDTSPKPTPIMKEDDDKKPSSVQPQVPKQQTVQVPIMEQSTEQEQDMDQEINHYTTINLPQVPAYKTPEKAPGSPSKKQETMPYHHPSQPVPQMPPQPQPFHGQPFPGPPATGMGPYTGQPDCGCGGAKPMYHHPVYKPMQQPMPHKPVHQPQPNYPGMHHPQPYQPMMAPSASMGMPAKPMHHPMTAYQTHQPPCPPAQPGMNFGIHEPKPQLTYPCAPDTHYQQPMPPGYRDPQYAAYGDDGESQGHA